MTSPRQFPRLYMEWLASFLEGHVAPTTTADPDECVVCDRAPSGTSGRIELIRVDPVAKKKKKLMLARTLYALREDIHPDDIPRGLLTAHTCCNEQCINPQHLYLTTRRGLRKGDRVNPPKSPQDRLESIALPLVKTGWVDIGAAAEAADIAPEVLRESLNGKGRR